MEAPSPVEPAVGPADAHRTAAASDGGDATSDVAIGGPSWGFDCNDRGTPKSGKSIGHTSVAFKLELSSGKKAAWKPNARKVKGRYRGEVATYRLAKALSIPNVPPACLRVFDAKAAAGALAAHADSAKVFADEVIIEQGHVSGVVIPWIDGLRFWPLEKEPLQSDVRSWLASSAEIPIGKRDLARQASDLVVLDFITGNWDRYSGENVGLDATGTLVLFIDNDAAFMEGPPRDQLDRNKARLESTQRFSRRLVAAIRALDEDHLAATLGDEAPGRPLVSKAVLTGVAARMKELIAVVDAKTRQHGEAITLYFP